MIDGYKVAQATGMGARVNTIMQTCFFAISGVLPREAAIEAIKNSIKKTYGKKGDQIVQQNFAAVDQTLANLFEVKVPSRVTSTIAMPPVVSPKAPAFVKEVTAEIMAGFGDLIPVSKMPVDGTFRHSGRSGTSRSRSPCGISRSAFSATSAPWSARMPQSG